MKILSLDPGIMTTGWAVLSGPERIDDMGIMRPDSKGWTPSFQRIAELCSHLNTLLVRYLPDTVLIEWDSGKVNVRRHLGGGAGLATHGAVTAAMWRDCCHWRGRGVDRAVVVVPENTWTRGVPKWDRAVAVEGLRIGYTRDNDGGYNIADAIGLAIWWMREAAVRGDSAEAGGKCGRH